MSICCNCCCEDMIARNENSKLCFYAKGVLDELASNEREIADLKAQVERLEKLGQGGIDRGGYPPRSMPSKLAWKYYRVEGELPGTLAERKFDPCPCGCGKLSATPPACVDTHPKL